MPSGIKKQKHKRQGNKPKVFVKSRRKEKVLMNNLFSNNCRFKVHYKEMGREVLSTLLPGLP
jgi:hypothetical protein